ncbi:BTB/POZ domain [Trinorchestia longiramus]|nr:BTB/POZ domain [Trinorchestia longiramus]
MMNGGGLLSLKWNNHRTAFFYVLSNLREKECYTDVTLACDGKFYPVHKLILSTCSEYFEQMFEQTQCKHPVIVLKDIRSEELESLLSYMYVGEVNVVQEKLSGLIKAAECLRIKGLAVPDEEPQPTKSSGGSREKRTSDNSLSSEAKRRRQDDSAFSSQKQTSSSSNREDSNRRRVDQSSSNKFNRNNASSSSNSGSVNSCRESRENTSERISSNREVAQSDEQQPSAVSEAGDDEIELKAEEPPDAEEDMPSEMPPSDADAVKQEPIDLDAVYLSDSNSASETKDMLVEDNFVEADGQQHFMDELLGQNSASDQHGADGVFEDAGGRPSTTSSLQQHLRARSSSSSERLQYFNSSSSETLGPHLSSLFNGASRGMAKLGRGTCSAEEVLPFDLLDFARLRHAMGYQCPLCGLWCRDKHLFRNHYRVHSGEKPFSCAFCTYRTNQKSNLNVHMRTHRDVLALAIPSVSP